MTNPATISATLGRLWSLASPALLACVLVIAGCAPGGPENGAPGSEFEPGVDEPRGGSETALCDPGSDVYLPGAAENLENWARMETDPVFVEREVGRLVDRLEAVTGLEDDVDLVRVQATNLLRDVDASLGSDELEASAGDLRRIAAAACDDLH